MHEMIALGHMYNIVTWYYQSLIFQKFYKDFLKQVFRFCLIYMNAYMFELHWITSLKEIYTKASKYFLNLIF